MAFNLKQYLTITDALNEAIHLASMDCVKDSVNARWLGAHIKLLDKAKLALRNEGKEPF